MVSLLLQWIQHHTVTFEERKFPASYEEIEVRVHLGQLLPGWGAAFFSWGQAGPPFWVGEASHGLAWWCGVKRTP